MLSKWLDVGMNLAAYHYQCRQYQNVRPPAFGHNPHVRNMTRERERQERMTEEETRARLEKEEEELLQKRQNNVVFAMWEKRRRRRRQRKRQKSLARLNHESRKKSITSKTPHVSYALPAPSQSRVYQGRSQHRRGETRPSQRFDKDFLNLVEQEQAHPGGIESPSLFLQESAHLISLLSAVAMSTLRTDNMETEPPLVEHIPGRPWPPVDPDCLSSEIRKEFNESSRFWTAVYFLLGLKGRSNREVTLYNAARPFRVLGGVSDEEMEELSKARGPEAKVSLCSMWLQEFITREYMAGSTGAVAPPILSRLYQFNSDGLLGYNQSRKISYIPFPFPHAQLTIFFIGVCVLVFPLLYFSSVNQLAFACIMNFTTVMCFVGVHEVARELEKPFQNVPNDLPLTTFQAQFNEALIAMYAGFHPDAWSVEDQVSSTPCAPQGVEDESTTAGVNESIENCASSDSSLDLLSFFRKEREEAGSKSKPKVGDEENLHNSPDPKEILKKATDTLFAGGDDHEDDEKNPPFSTDPTAILRQATATLFGEAQDLDTDQEKVSRDSPRLKSILRKAPATSFRGNTEDGDGIEAEKPTKYR